MRERKKNQEKIEFLEKVANGMMWWIGSVQSVIVHTVFFAVCFLLPILKIIEWDQMLLVLTTVVSLEAIYLAIFIQMSVNKSTEHIEDLKEDVTEIQEDIEDIQEDIEEISDDIEDIQEDIEEINEDEDEQEDHGERARTVMLKSKVATNKTEIRSLKDKISEMEALIRELQEEDDDIEDELNRGEEENY